jgi:hypothetical protein
VLRQAKRGPPGHFQAAHVPNCRDIEMPASRSWPLPLAATVFLILVVAMFVAAPHLRAKEHALVSADTAADHSTDHSTESAAGNARGNAKFYWRFIMREGIPFIRIRLASQPDHPFLCVLDSGSADLNVASPECDFCDAAHGVYESSVHRGLRTTLAYGSQVDTAVVKRDRVILTEGGDAQSAAAAAVDVHVTVERTRDSSNFNVFGLSSTGFLAKLLGPARALLINFPWHNTGGFVTSIGLQEAAAYRACALVHAPLEHVRSLPFYMVRVKALRVGGVAVPAPRYCIFDTGSNVVSVPPASFEALAPRLGIGRSIEVVFGERGPEAEDADNADNADNAGRIVVPHAHYTYFSQLMVDDDVPDFGVGSMMVLGCNGMLGHTFVFERRHVSVVRSDNNVCDGVHRV